MEHKSYREGEKEEEAQGECSKAAHQEKAGVGRGSMVDKIGKHSQGGDNETLLGEEGEEMIVARILVGQGSSFTAPCLLPYLTFGMICNILSQLPPRTLGRMKLVCKDWRDLIDSPYFVLRLHLRCSRMVRPCICFRIVQDSSSFVYTEDNGHGICNALLNTNIHPADLWISMLIPLSTCNGLLFYVDEKIEAGGFRCYFYVMNPVTREKMQLPPIFIGFPEIEACQLVWDEEAGKWGVYKVLLIYRNKDHLSLVFTLGVDCNWRSIFNPYRYWRDRGVGNYGDLEHPRIGGAIHRLYDNTTEYIEGNDEERPLKFVAAFDIREEKFREIKLPNECSLPENKSSIGNDDGRSCKLQLIEIRSLLCILQLNISERVLDAWLLVDYDRGMWTKQHSVVMDSLVLGCRDISAFAKISDKRVLIQLVDHPNEDEGHKAIVSYSPQRGIIKRVNQVVGYTTDEDLFCGVFAESLVPLARDAR